MTPRRAPGSAPPRPRARTRSLEPGAPRPGARGPFAESWWGGAWVRALEESALDAGRLARGRTYARGGHVETITVAPGRIAAPVRGSRPRPYHAVLRLAVLTDEEWDAFLDAVAGRPGHIAALLDRDMPHALVDAADAAGVRLLPGPGEPAPACSCPDRGHPCKHAAALCYETARFLDHDPFVLLLLRGRDEDELLDALSRRNAALAAREARTTEARARPDTGEPSTPSPGVPASEALATGVRPPLPGPLAPPPAPGAPPPLPELPGAPDPDDLAFLAADASARAYTALAGGPDVLAPLPEWHDAVRLAATHPQLTGRGTFTPRFAALAHASGRTAQELARAAAAWRQGGPEGLAVLEAPWDPPAGSFDRARGALSAAHLPRMSPWRNHLTAPAGDVQLRFGRDARWYPYRRGPAGPDDWWPEGPPTPDPVAALTGLGEE